LGILKKRINNKGLSLIELLVAIGISGILLLMIGTIITEGTRHFKEESIKSSLQNDLQIIENNVNKAIMEAPYLDIENVGDEIYIYTGEISNTDNLLIKNVGTERVITFKEENIYVTAFNDADGTKLTKGYSLSGNVSEFLVEVSKKGTIYKNPLILNIKLTLKNSDITVSSDMKIRLRNKLDKIKINGSSYNVE